MRQKEKSKRKSLPKSKPLGLYLFLMFTIFPLFCTDGYFHIRLDRYYFFLWSSLGAMVVQGLFRLLGGSENRDLPHNLQAVKAVADGAWYRRLSAGDWAMVLFVLAAAVSALWSEYPAESFYGTLGRNNGVILLAVYAGVYFIVSRCYDHRNYIFVGLALCTTAVSVLAVLNFYHLDPLNMIRRLAPEDRLIFISTIGNKNLLSAYLCMMVPAAGALFIFGREKPVMVVSLLASMMGFAGLMCADSDSGFLGMGAFAVVFLLICIPNPERLKRYFLVLTVMLLGARVPALFGDHHKALGAFQQFFVASTESLCLIPVMAAVTALLYLLHHKKPQLRFPKGVRNVLSLMVAATLLATVAAVVYVTFLAPDYPLESPWTLLRVDDRWGTLRGFIWKRSFLLFGDFSLKEKLLGSGPDTYYGVFSHNFAELIQLGGNAADAAHNEYLNYLITQGLVGLGAWLTLLVSNLVHALRGMKTDPMYAVFAAAVIGCSAQAMVNIAQPITTPLMILFIALCGAKIPLTSTKGPSRAYHKKR